MNDHEPIGQLVRRQAAQLWADALASTVALEATEQSQLTSLSRDTELERDRLQRAFRNSSAHTGEEHDAQLTTAQETLARAAAELHGPLGAVADAVPGYEPQLPPPGRCVVGQVGQTPIVVPLLGAGGLMVRGHEAGVRHFTDAVVLRLIAAVPLKSLRFTVFDPRISGLLGSITGLREHTTTALFPKAFVENDALRERLDLITSAVQASSDRLSTSEATNILETWAQASNPPLIDVLVIDDQPGGLDERSVNALQRLIERGPAHGVVPIVLQGNDGGELNLNYASLSTLDFFPDNDADLLLGNDLSMAIQPLRTPTPQERGAVVASSASATKDSTGPKVHPNMLLPQESRQSSADGIKIVIGEREDGRPLELEFRSENPPTTNALIGGAVGTGKSNLLHTLVYATAAKYGPDQVDMILVDLKEGLEFQRFKADDGQWLPNASVVALESDRQFGLAVLQHVQEEKSRRSRLFRDQGLSSFDAYRAAGHSLPRQLVIIDEFQVLFDGDDELAHQAVALLTDIVKTGRAMGIHLVLSSQTLSGIRSLASRLDSIFSQVSIRIALQNTESESQTILSQGNRAAAQLRHRGQVVLNTLAGQSSADNTIGMITHADPSFTRELQERLIRENPRSTPSRIFAGNAPEPWDASVAADAVGSLVQSRGIAVGRAVTVNGDVVVHRFTDDTNQAAAIVGSTKSLVLQTLTAAVASAAPAAYERVVVLDAEDSELGRALLQGGTAQVPLTFVPPRDAAQWLRALEHAPGTGQMLLVVPQVGSLPNLRTPPPPDPEKPFEVAPTAADVLRKVARRELPVPADVLVAANGFADIDSVFGMDRDGGNGIGAYLMIHPTTADVRRVIGQQAERPEGEFRFLYARAGTSEPPVVGVPFEFSTVEEVAR